LQLQEPALHIIVAYIEGYINFIINKKIQLMVLFHMLYF